MSHQIRLEDHVYERIKANKRDDESFSDAVERIIGRHSLCDLRDVFDDDQVVEMRDAIETADKTNLSLSPTATLEISLTSPSKRIADIL
jgi:predicted CopG family antitoxin